MVRADFICFIDIGGIDDHHCLNFLFITNTTVLQSEGVRIIEFNVTFNFISVIL